MKTPYSFTVLRYMHDVLTGEFVNVGVALYAPTANYIGAICNPRYGRISRMFGSGEVDSNHFRSLMNHIEGYFNKLGNKLREELPFNGNPANIMEIAKGVLPPDDSSLKWSEMSGGCARDPAKALEDIYNRMVGCYDQSQVKTGRDNNDVWRTFKGEFDKQNITSRLQPKRITSPDEDYEFEYAWENHRWHVYQPLSLDLLTPEAITDKANRWLGRGTNLKESTEKFVVHLLLGAPSNPKMRAVYNKAENILFKMPIDKEFVRESDASDFSKQVAEEMKLAQ